MASSDLMVGLEIGTSKICVVVGEGRPDGTIKILGVGQAPSRGVRKGEIVVRISRASTTAAQSRCPRNAMRSTIRTSRT
jgi:cell division ATPase FtsA